MLPLDMMGKALLLTFLVSSMLSIGLQTGVAELRLSLASKGFLVRMLLANFVVVPALGVVIALLFPLQPHVAGALVLLASTPGGLSTINYTPKEGNATLAGLNMCVLFLLAVFISPLLLWLVLPEHIHLLVPRGAALLFFFVSLVLPLLGGMLLLAKLPGAGAKLSKLMALAAFVAFCAFGVVNGALRKAATGEIGGAAVGALVLFIVGSMAVGWLMGGPGRDTRRLLATTSSMRNIVLSLAIVQSTAPGHPALMPLVAFSLLMVPPNLLLTLYSGVQARRRARKDRVGGG
jgi:bile acid:Na+ symporter, BASS family